MAEIKRTDNLSELTTGEDAYVLTNTKGEKVIPQPHRYA